MKTEFAVTGMTCAACSARVEKAALSVPGVESCTVSLLTNTMFVEGDAAPEAVAEAVEKAGYGASLKGALKKAAPEPAAEKQKSGLAALIASAVILLILMFVAMGHMASLSLPAWLNPMAQGLVQFLLSGTILLIHRRFFSSGVRAALRGAPNMDTLVSLGSGVSFGYSLVLLFGMTGAREAGQMRLLHGLYFDSAAMILVLVSVGKLLEARAKGKTTSAIRSLQKLAPPVARVLRDGAETELSPEELQKGTLLVVRPGESFAADGVVAEGESAVDESALTGESVPVDKQPGARVYTGTTNLSGRLVVTAEKVGGDTMLSRMIDRVVAASASKAPIARLADRVAAVFVPCVLGLAMITFAVWLFFASFADALSHGIAVLVVSCPCALGLATPVAIMVSSGVAARHGVLFKTAVSLEALGKTETVVLDKTGTITSGQMRVSDLVPAEGLSENEFLLLAASLEEGSTHPLAKAIGVAARARSIEPRAVEGFRSLAGRGVEGTWQGQVIYGGKKEWIERQIPLPSWALERADRLAREGKTPLFFASRSAFLGLVAVSDTVKEDSAEAVAAFSRMGIESVMMTGDRADVAHAVADTVGIRIVLAGVLPEGKEAEVRRLKEGGRKVCMVGDGINDAPALAAADLGVSVGAGMDAAIESAEVVLMNDRLSDLASAIRLSRKTLINIKENLFWAFGYNLIGIPLAAGVFEPVWGWRLVPMFGAAAMSVSSILVVTNALRLQSFRWRPAHNQQNVKENKTMKQTEKIISIEGMMCPHCEAHVVEALKKIPGVEQASASHEKKEARLVLSAPVSDDSLKKAVEDAGYRFLG